MSETPSASLLSGNKISDKSRTIALLFLIIISNLLWVPGLQYTLSENNYTLTKLNQTIDPFLNPEDLYYPAITSKPSLLFTVMTPFLKLLSPYWVVLIFFIIQNILCVLGTYHLLGSFKQFDKEIVWWSTLFLTIGGMTRFALGSTAPFGWQLFSDVTGTAILLFTFGEYFRGRFYSAAILLSLVFHIHIVTAVLASIFLLLAIIFRYDEHKFRPLVLPFLIVFGSAFLFYITNPAITSSATNTDFSQLLAYLQIRRANHSFPSRFGFSQWIPFLFLVIFFMVSFNSCKDRLFRKVMFAFSLAGTFLILLGWFFAEVVPVFRVIQLAPCRGTRFLLFIFIPVIILFFKNLITNKKLFPLLAGTVLLAVTFANLIVFHPVYRQGIVLSKILSPLARFFHNQNVASSMFLKPLNIYKAWYDVQIEVSHLPKQSKNEFILSPPYLRGFRSFSHRSVVFEFDGGGDAPIYYPHTFANVMKRFQLFSLDPLNFKTRTAVNQALRKRYLSLTSRDLKRIHAAMPFTLIITESNHSLDLPLLYDNNYFRIYSYPGRDDQ